VKPTKNLKMDWIEVRCQPIKYRMPLEERFEDIENHLEAQSINQHQEGRDSTLGMHQ
jgi:hypothetical protein